MLPFLNIDGSDETRIFCDGLVEDVISRLAATPPLKVASRGDSFALGPNSASGDVRRRLRVSYYLQGSVRRSGDMLLIVARLIDSATASTSTRGRSRSRSGSSPRSKKSSRA